VIVAKLRELQDRFGYLPDDELKRFARDSKIPLSKIQDVAGFYPHFRQEWNKPKRVEVHVCRDMACHLRGAQELTAKLAAIPGDIEVHGTSCLGRCDRPVACVVSRHGDEPIHEALYLKRSAEEMTAIVKAIAAGETPPPNTDTDRGIDRSTWQIDPYTAGEWPKYEAVRTLITESPPVPPGEAEKPHPWLDVLNAAGLLGMGGAGVPAYRKWFDVWKAKPADGSGEKYVICNGDESEPATFKDREILLHAPHIVVEGVILAGVLSNATAGFIYIRHEYPEQIAAVRQAIAEAEAIGACGADVFGRGRAFPVSVFVSPGGYVCGEQSALIEAMEDKRSQPRNKPPELSTNGYRDRPTIVNNVETLAWTPAIFLRGGEWYATNGATGCKGRRLFSICGDLAKPGVFEVPIGTTLGKLIALAGGMRDGLPPFAVALSGPSGGLVPAKPKVVAGWESRLAGLLKDLRGKEPEIVAAVAAAVIVDGRLDITKLPLDKGLFGHLATITGIDLMLGAGLAVYAEGVDALAQAVSFTEFFRNESCGKCVPCRIGSQKLVEIGTGLLKKQTDRAGTTKDVLEIVQAMQVTSICGLGQVAGNPLASVLKLFDDS
jgi:NADH:ubiquinone oxidoreductase subunit F (NADH-binding)/NADH:ubiquinone oxidoreductase subunit E